MKYINMVIRSKVHLARTCQLRIRGKRLSAIPVMTTNGLEDVYVTANSVNGGKFEYFIGK